MPQSQLYPSQLIASSTESFLREVSVRSQVIYITVVVTVLGALVALPFIRVDVTVQSAGIIRPLGERNELRSLVAGTVTEVRVRENQPVTSGQILLVLQSDVTDGKIRFNQQQRTEKEALVADLSQLVRLGGDALPALPGLRSALYRQQYAQFRAQTQETLDHQRKTLKELEADRQLYAEKVIAMREMDDKEYNYQKLLTEYRSALARQLSQWQADLTTHRMALAELQTQAQQLAREKDLYALRAPTAGTVQQLAGKYPGSFVQAGELLGLVSPDAHLVVECALSPHDIGPIRAGQRVRFQVDAFDYNAWGTATGRVTEVSNDVAVVDGKPVFRVRCRLDQTHLRLPNGYRGQLKKGMTLRARFLLTRRSLYQLLYDQADDWVNPGNG